MSTPAEMLSASLTADNQISCMLELRKQVKKNRQRDTPTIHCQDDSSLSAKFIDSTSGSAEHPVQCFVSPPSTSNSAPENPTRKKTKTHQKSLRNGWSIPWRWSRRRVGIKRRRVVPSVVRKINKRYNQKTALEANIKEGQSVSPSNKSSPERDHLSYDNTCDSHFSSHSLSRHGNQYKKDRTRRKNIIHKYEPKLFEDVAGHELTIKAITNAVEKKKVAPLYLFHGPSGTGKNSVAKIFAMALNCESSLQNKPCWSCRGCSRSLYIMELCRGNRISGFHRISTLLQSTSFTQAFPGCKVFIIEECQLLDTEAWNELLGTLDGRYGCTMIFVLITLDANMVPKVVSSRCQKFCFPKLKEMDITLKLVRIATKEDVQIDTEALKLISAKADGSLREAENILDQLILLGPRITSSMVQQIVGLVPRSKLNDLLTTAFQGDARKIIRLTEEHLAMGIEPRALVSQLASLVADILSHATATVVPDSSSVAGPSTDVRFPDGVSQLDCLCHALKILVAMERQPRSFIDDSTLIFSTLLQIASQEYSNRASIVLPRGRIPSGKNPNVESVEIQYQRLTSSRSLKKGNSSSSNPEQQNTDKHKSDELSKRIYNGQAVGESQTMLSGMRNMEEIWLNMLERIQNSYVKEFLSQQVKLVSLTLSSASAIVHLMFKRSEDKLAAQMSEESISKALKSAIGCTVTVNMSLEPVNLGITEEDTGSSSKNQQAESRHSLQQQITLFLPESVYNNNREAKDNISKMKLKDIMLLPQGQDGCSKREKNAIEATAQHLPDSITQNQFGRSASPRTNPSHRNRSKTEAGKNTRAKKPKHRWLSLSSITQSGVEPYSLDILFENATSEKERRTLQNSKHGKGFPNTHKDQHLQENSRSIGLYRSWSCKDVLFQTKPTARKLHRGS